MEHLPEDLCPYWDLTFGDGDDEPRDSSSAVIAVCGMLEMSKYMEEDDRNFYTSAALKIMKQMIEKYSVKDPAVSNGQLLAGTYSKKTPYNTCNEAGVDECVIWGDYFYMEALNRILDPDWVPSLILQITLPEMVGTLTSPPKTAVVKGTETVVYTSIPLRSKPGFVPAVTFKSRSPAWPPPAPGAPFPFRRMVFPDSMPAGICTCRDRMLPSCFCSRITLSQPKAASSKLTDTSACRSAPFRAPP